VVSCWSVLSLRSASRSIQCEISSPGRVDNSTISCMSLLTPPSSVSRPVAPLVDSFGGAPAPINPSHYIQLDLRCERSVERDPGAQLGLQVAFQGPGRRPDSVAVR
jgi:hypothetical protein